MRRKKKRKEMIGWTNARINSRERWLIRWNSMSRAGRREKRRERRRERKKDEGKCLNSRGRDLNERGKDEDELELADKSFDSRETVSIEECSMEFDCIWKCMESHGWMCLFPWNYLYWRMFDGIRLHMKVYGITCMNVLIPVELSLLKNVRWNSIAYESV